MLMTPPARIYLEPAAGQLLHEAVREGGGRLVGAAQADAIVWASKDVTGLYTQLHPGIRWVQLPDAGVERWMSAALFSDDRIVTCAGGCYAPQVAEHALALMLACAHRIPEAAAQHHWPVQPPHGTTLHGATVTIVGAGSIGTALIAMLAPFHADITAVTRAGRPVPGAATSIAVTDLHRALAGTQYVVLCAPATPATHHLIAANEFAAMRRDAWLINVGRGQLVNTEALLRATTQRTIAGAALDVTDPEPLPAEHALWQQSTVLITPHTANPPHLKAAAYAAHVTTNTARFMSGQPLLAQIDPGRGY